MCDEQDRSQSAMANERSPRGTPWTCVLKLDATRTPIAGTGQALVDAIRRGADLRIGTEFLHNEHIDVRSVSQKEEESRNGMR